MKFKIRKDMIIGYHFIYEENEYVGNIPKRTFDTVFNSKTDCILKQNTVTLYVKDSLYFHCSSITLTENKFKEIVACFLTDNLEIIRE